MGGAPAEAPARGEARSGETGFGDRGAGNRRGKVSGLDRDVEDDLARAVDDQGDDDHMGAAGVVGALL